MSVLRIALLVVSIALLSTTLVLTAPVSAARVPAVYDNCTAFNKRYLHGVGRAGARDRTRGATPRVTTFKRSTRLYRLAMRYNSDLDRDDDGIACEK
jgi:excalibur calcium-binding domain-containing protein